MQGPTEIARPSFSNVNEVRSDPPADTGDTLTDAIDRAFDAGEVSREAARAILDASKLGPNPSPVQLALLKRSVQLRGSATGHSPTMSHRIAAQFLSHARQLVGRVEVTGPTPLPRSRVGVGGGGGAQAGQPGGPPAPLGPTEVQGPREVQGSREIVGRG